MTREALRQRKKKYHAWKRYTETKSYADHLAAKKEAQAMSRLIRQAQEIL